MLESMTVPCAVMRLQFSFPPARVVVLLLWRRAARAAVLAALAAGDAGLAAGLAAGLPAGLPAGLAVDADDDAGAVVVGGC